MSLSKSSVAATWSAEKILQTNKLIRNTYLLLSASLLFSAAVAGLAMTMGFSLSDVFGSMNIFLFLILYFGCYSLLQYLVYVYRNSVWGIFWVFALTGFCGFTLGSILTEYIRVFSNGHQLIMMALGGTGVMFLGLSGYALTTRKNFSFMGGFLSVAFLTIFIAALVAIIFDLSALRLAASVAFVLLSSAYILYHTSEMVHGGETNYICATVSLYIHIYNLFTNLLRLLAHFYGRRR